jgi:hypothetical protein
MKRIKMHKLTCYVLHVTILYFSSFFLMFEVNYNKYVQLTNDCT